MAFPKYIAWVDRIGGTCWSSVSMGTRSKVEQAARDTINSALWRDLHPDGGRVRITTDGSQRFVHSFIVK